MTAIRLSRDGRWRDLVPTAGGFLLGLAVLSLFLALAGFAVGPALGALWRGAFGSWDAIASATLVRATPLIMLGLAFAIGNQGGGLNIGMEGQFALGALLATWVGQQVSGFPGPVAILATLVAGCVGGAAWMVVPVALRIRYGVTEVISTLLLNFVAVALVSYAVTGPLQEPSRVYPQSAPIAVAARLPRLIPGQRLHFGIVLSAGIGLLFWLLLTRSRWGFRLRAVGAGPVAARVIGGMPVPRILAGALLISGALAGLGGAAEVSGVSYALYQNLSPGYGFTAIAVALLGRLSPAGVVLSGLLFGALEAGAGAMQRDAAIPAVAVQVVEAVVILTLVMAGKRKR